MTTIYYNMGSEPLFTEIELINLINAEIIGQDEIQDEKHLFSNLEYDGFKLGLRLSKTVISKYAEVRRKLNESK